MATELIFKNVNIGDKMPTLVKEPVTLTQLVKYAGASGDFNPLHFDDEFAKNAGMGEVIAHGMLIMGFAGQAITNWVPRKNLRAFSARFIGVTKLGETVTINGTVTQKGQENGENIVTVEIIASAQDGNLTLKGEFKAACA